MGYGTVLAVMGILSLHPCQRRNPHAGPIQHTVASDRAYLAQRRMSTALSHTPMPAMAPRPPLHVVVSSTHLPKLTSEKLSRSDLVQRPSSPAAGSGSDAGADAGGSQVQRLVRRCCAANPLEFPRESPLPLGRGVAIAQALGGR